MHEHEHPELGRLGPERVVLRQRQILAVDMAANRRAAQAKALHRVLQLLGGEIGMLQCDRGKGDEAIGMRRHPFRQPLVLRLHDPFREIALRGVPPVAVDAQRLDVDALLIHYLQPRRSEHAAAATAASTGVPELRPFDDLGDVDDAVTVDVDHLHAFPADRHLTARRRSLQVDAGGRACHRGDELSTSWHKAPFFTPRIL